jgi:hypothetical protein
VEEEEEEEGGGRIRRGGRRRRRRRRLFPNIWTLPPFQWNYYQSSYCKFFLHSDLETWLYT